MMLAQNPTGLGGDLKGIGPIGLEDRGAGTVFVLFPQVISTIVGVLTAGAILWFLVQFILGAYKWISSGGDAKQLEGARNQITQAIVGIVLVFIALIFASVLGNIFGLDILDLDAMIRKLGPYRNP
jgi:hypothetical protein